MPNGRKQDKEILIECLTLIEGELQIIIATKKLFRQEFVEDIPGPWDEVQRHFEGARRQIENDSIDWQYVEGAGLVGRNLAWKRNILAKAAKQRIVGRFLKLANTFLGSLGKAIPAVEFIKEYKEFIEGCLKVIPSLR